MAAGARSSVPDSGSHSQTQCCARHNHENFYHLEPSHGHTLNNLQTASVHQRR